ncbi:hypothetical protein CHS0354_039351 [Potamilus streckersoni]|uniref:Uncharacterized protein n=1 Tax=Potamilus streckersoni TaxID=2493646 RepID=A0AAE0T485_9BIVA|nr:hypothetical protein CHS0354_039351 [Potamilus streckersoni]
MIPMNIFSLFLLKRLNCNAIFRTVRLYFSPERSEQRLQIVGKEGENIRSRKFSPSPPSKLGRQYQPRWDKGSSQPGTKSNANDIPRSQAVKVRQKSSQVLSIQTGPRASQVVEVCQAMSQGQSCQKSSPRRLHLPEPNI